jgi:hypothetical protein
MPGVHVPRANVRFPHHFAGLQRVGAARPAQPAKPAGLAARLPKISDHLPDISEHWSRLCARLPRISGSWPRVPGLLPKLFDPLPRLSGRAVSLSVGRNQQLWIAGGVLALGSFFSTVLFNQHVQPQPVFQVQSTQSSLVQSSLVLKAEQALAFAHRWTYPDMAADAPTVATDASGDDIDPNLRRPVRTVRFARLGGEGEIQGAPVPAARVRPTIPDIEVANELPGRSGNLDEVAQYLWEVYQRQPVKKDGSGDFTWKDPAAAKRLNITLADYVIGGMDPDFREQLYHAGRAMDAAGLQWSMLSAFRDDYRQRLASGFKARVGNSLHGGSRRTGGYGHGRAIDITLADNPDAAETVWRWIDAHGAKYGLSRPMPGYDPAHIQSRGDYHVMAMSLRQARIRTAQANGGAAAPKVTTAAAQ